MNVNTIKKFIKDDRGIETRVLLYILAAIVLVLLIAFVTGLIGSMKGLVDQAIGKANATMNETG